MKGAAQKWVGATVFGVSLMIVAGSVRAADVTDADRTYRNYTRETATVAEGQIRVELRGLQEQDENHTRLNLLGFPISGVDRLSGGVIDLVGSYGVTKNAELGFIVPGYIETLHFKNATQKTDEDVGDLQLYGKFKRSVAEHCSVGAGLELSLPNGPEAKGFGTGELGLKPVISTRYQRGPFAVGANVGYEFYSGDVPDVLNYGAEVIVRGSSAYAIRTEIAGRVFDQGGTRFNDLTILPGIDVNISENLTIRPTGLANATDTALDWGIGLGVAATF